ncbi:MAG TPA: flagellar hook-basal body protein [Candidatus Hydrogenedentes bacterium]|nr:flagellar hook-basal body protein [Candidatus Hydrogenedentota bacterium]HIJ74459.1 flagellar hook-basal body protein [Candidatus Hydrogenedentota bacterium]
MEGLYISASGIANALRRNDVTAHNVANLGTAGYRAARAESVELASGGAALGSISRDDSSGPIEVTGQSMDVAVSAGFFRVRAPDGATAFTRDGHFGLNADGEVVTADGARLDPPIQVPGNATHVSVTRDGAVYATVPGGAGPEMVGRLEVFRFANPDGLLAIGGNLYRQTPASGEPVAVPGATEFYPGAVQGSNVNLARETTNSVLDRHAFQANVNAFRAQSDMLGELINIVG